MNEANTKTDRLKEITAELENGISRVFQSEQYRSWLNTMSKFHRYSLNNTILISMQKPDATLVAGYNAWKEKFGRQVRRGEKAIRIIAPAPYKVREERDRTDPVTGEVLFHPDGRVQKETVEITRPAFKVASVFDVSQTDGKELPTLGVNELSGDVNEYETIISAIRETCPVPVIFEDIQNGAKGYYHQTEQRIVLQRGMSQIQTIKTLIHEMTHQRLHAIDPKENALKKPEPDVRSTREVEAESVAYTICSHYGIDTSEYSFGYIAGWSAGKELPELKASMETIRRTASEMITQIDERIRERQQEKAKESPDLAAAPAARSELLARLRARLGNQHVEAVKNHLEKHAR